MRATREKGERDPDKTQPGRTFGTDRDPRAGPEGEQKKSGRGSDCGGVEGPENRRRGEASHEA